MSTRDKVLLSAEAEEAIAHLRQNSVGRLLLRASRRYNETAIRRVRALGHERLTLAHASILPHIDIRGTRLTELASRAGLTKQSTSELVSALQQLGYIARQPDPDDRRSQRVVFTNRGKEFLRAAYQAKTELEQDLRERLGKHQGEQLMALLRKYIGPE